MVREMQDSKKGCCSGIPGGVVGIRGAKGPYGATNELDLLQHLIAEFAQASCNQILFDEEGNPYQHVDGYVILQTLDVLRRYYDLLAKHLNEFVRA